MKKLKSLLFLSPFLLYLIAFSATHLIKVEEVIKEIIEPDPIPVCELHEHNKIYLAINECYTLDDTGYLTDGAGVVALVGDRIRGIQPGKTLLSKDCNTYEVVVTDLITVPYASEEKEELPCGRYTVEENEFLDEVLAGKIRDKGYQTRAGAVEAARFLLLQFPYHMSYFSENGRYYGFGPLCEGEGRYYHEGLYLNVYKAEKESFVATVHGPQPWGCKMFSNPANTYQSNSLDCSGFVTWCLVNGGFDPGDLGAGPDPSHFDYTDLGERHKITEESLDEVKVGDLFSAEGHISILIGKKDGLYYIAESNLGIDIKVRISTKEELLHTDFYQWIDMDEFYGHQDGQLTDYWE